MWIFGRKGASGFSACSTAEEVARGIDASGLTAIVTGASCGIGTETARILAQCGVHVIVAVRNVDSGKKVKETIIKENHDAKIDVMELDLSSMASIRKFASEYNNLSLPLNLLVNNAGLLAPTFTLSQDNIELHFATNHIESSALRHILELSGSLENSLQVTALSFRRGHYLLTNLLLDNMKKTARESQKEGRIINVSSMGHRFVYREGIRFDQINDSSSYSSILAYGQSKLANILHATELARRLKEEGAEIIANSLHPGAIATNLIRHHGFIQGFVNWVGKYFIKNIPQGAATTCYVALHPQVKGVSGKYFADSNVANPNSLARDVDLAEKLWDFSLNMTETK